jgi:hypothetical protein
MEGRPDLQPIFIVERYFPGLTPAQVTALADRLVTGTRHVRASGYSVFWLGSTALLGEETTFCLFRAPSREAVSAVNELASAPYERIVEALYLEGEIAPEQVERRPSGAFPSSGGGIWTQFPDQITYRFTELPLHGVRRLEAT